jgi:hypothetical protein
MNTQDKNSVPASPGAARLRAEGWQDTGSHGPFLWTRNDQDFYTLEQALEMADSSPAAPAPGTSGGAQDELIRTLIGTIEKAQASLAAWIVPDSKIADAEVIGSLLLILDDKSLVETVRNARAALSRVEGR